MHHKEKIRGKIAEVLGLDAGRVGDDIALTDLVASSFLLVEMVIEVQEEFDVRFGQAEMMDVATVSDFLDLVEGRMAVATN